MPTYTAYGLTVRSSIDFPELHEAPDAEAADLQIRTEALEPRGPARVGRRYVETTEAGVYVRYSNDVQMCIQGGCRLIVDPAEEEAAWVRQCVLGPGLALLLQQRGGVVLHGSAVRTGDAATILVGAKGEGKSTAAAALTRRGYDLLTDDVTAVRWPAGAPVVQTGFSHLKLAPDASEALAIPPEDLTPYHSLLPKRILQTLRPTVDSAPVGRICVLETADELTIEPLGLRFALGALLPHLYAQRFLGPASVTQDLLGAASRLVQEVPVLRFARPRDLRRLHDGLDLLLAAPLASFG